MCILIQHGTMEPLKIVQTSELSEEQKNQILRIWNSEYPEFLAYSNVSGFDRYLDELENSRHYIAKYRNEIIGWVCLFDRDEEKWFVTLVSSSSQKSGVGSRLIQTAKADSNALNGWVIEKDSYLKANGDLYKSPLAFYEKNGFEKTNDHFSNKDFEAVRVTWGRCQ